MHQSTLLLTVFLFCSVAQTTRSYAQSDSAIYRFVEASPANPSYFTFSDGETYIPIGINMINPSGRYRDDPDSAFCEIEQWMKALSENGGNYIRVWLSNSFWDMEEEAGKYSPEKVNRIDRFIAMARKYHLRIKLTLEHFRSVTLEENPQQWATKFAYHTSHGGPLDSVREYLTTKAGQELFLNKLDFYQKHYGSDTLFFGWELWNEMNAMHVPKDSAFISWNRKMLAAVKERFPENLVMQSLGSFDRDDVRPLYKQITSMPGNEVAQVHRYLDPGASLEVCHAPMDIICYSAVNELLSYHLAKPVLLAETGAVEAHHAGPSRYYARDTAGMLLHDILFAPFFSGAAGTGMSWHWDSYVAKNNLWYHFSRFVNAIKDVDPIKESFIPSFKENSSLRIYILEGKQTTLLWLRDKSNTWEAELEQGVKPGTIHALNINLADLGIGSNFKAIEIYDPWKNSWSAASSSFAKVLLPDFKRSIVIRLHED